MKQCSTSQSFAVNYFVNYFVNYLITVTNKHEHELYQYAVDKR